MRALGLEESGGILVMDVAGHGPGARGGLQKREILIGLGGRRLAGIDDLLALLTEEAIGEVLTLRILRGIDERSVVVNPEERGEG